MVHAIDQDAVGLLFGQPTLFLPVSAIAEAVKCSASRALVDVGHQRTSLSPNQDGTGRGGRSGMAVNPPGVGFVVGGKRGRLRAPEA